LCNFIHGENDDRLVAKEYLKTLELLGQGTDNKTVFLPYEATGVLSSLGGIKELLK
jgi:hypothetical protein